MNIDIIFVLKGRELVRYDYQNEFSGERQATKEQLAHDNDVDVEDIKIFWQIDNKFNIKLFRDLTIYGEYENLDYKNTFDILCECLNNGNSASVKVNKKNYYISKNEDLRHFVDEYGEKELER